MKNIVLIGFMGTGKSEVGRQVARRFGLRFVDADRVIEKKARKPIPQIFDQLGEKRFREMERTVIRDLAALKSVVIATGGGAVLDSGNVKALRQNGLLVCLEASPETILSRVAGTDRPLLKDGDPMERIRELLSARRSFYNQADAVVETTDRSIQEVTEEVVRAVDQVQMDRIRVDLGDRSYEIRVGSGTLGMLGEAMIGSGLDGRVALISNPRVSKLYGKTVMQSLKKAGLSAKIFLVPDGENHKTLKSARSLYDDLVRNRFERDSSLVALGGGVIGDLGGFVAATYLRGIPYVQVPTTLAAQVDASIGGKTAVNHPLGKNLIGAFHQPRLVFSDIQVLSTLSRREYLSGLAEVIKYGVIADAAFFKFLENEIDAIVKRDESALRHAIRRSCEIKASVVQEDEREGDRRRILNYGHTLGHALEAVTGYRRYLHGEAVSIGMAFAARLARNLGFCDRETENRQVRLIQRAGLPAVLPKKRTADILRAMKVDKKVKGGSIYFVLADQIGHALVRPVTTKEVTGLLQS